MIAGLLLAAGSGVRFGGDKLLAPLHGAAVVRRSAEPLAAAVDVVHVVVRAGESRIAEALRGLRVHLVANPDAAEGMASSIRAGIHSLPGEWECVVIALGDQPYVAPDVISALVARWRRGDADAVAPRYDDGRGNPVLLGRALAAGLTALTGDTGARSLLETLGERLALVDVPGRAPTDVDTPDALQALARRPR